MKKFSDKFKFSELLHMAKVGFEFEFYSNSSYYKTLEVLNNTLSPIKVHGFKDYHSSFTPDEKNFKIEPDRSGGSNMVELVTGPIPYTNSKLIMLKILKFIQEHGKTNDKCAIHMNISFDSNKINKNINSINSLKMILNFDEELVYKYFPNRQNNIYAKSIKNLIPYKNYSYVTSAVALIQNNFHLPNKKYYGINFSHIDNTDDSRRLEFRYCGGEDYEYKTTELIELLDYFIKETWVNCSIDLDEGDLDLLKTYLNDNITLYKNFSTLQSFLTDHPRIDLQVNRNNNYDYVNSYFTKIKDKLFEIFVATEKMENCVINYTPANNELEIIDATVKTVLDIKGFTFIDCDIKSSMLTGCAIIDSKVEDCHINNSKIYATNIEDSRLLMCNVESDTVLTNCYYNGGIMDAKMDGGIIRAGKLGPNGEISSSTRIIRDTKEDFFGIKRKDIDIKKKK